MLEEKTPESVRHGRKGRQIYKNAGCCNVGDYDPASKDETDEYHKCSAEDELISADKNRLFGLGKALHKHGGECVGHGRENDEAVAEEIHSKSKTVEIDAHYAGKSENAGYDLLDGQLFLPEDEACNKHAEEC